MTDVPLKYTPSAVVLGIDAAWGTRAPSGVALVRGTDTGWECIASAPSYGSFLAIAQGKPVDWTHRPLGGEADVALLLAAATDLAGVKPSVVCIDMPMSLQPIVSRRAADESVSKAYGRFLCAAHSPSAARPGEISDRLTAAFSRHGYPLATATTEVGTVPALVEAYPHPAIVELLGLQRRLEYKVSKSSSYWPGSSLMERRRRLLERLSLLQAELTTRLGDLPVAPPVSLLGGLAELKRYEDVLDALVCCFVGVEYLSGRAHAMGDGTAAIWCPQRIVAR